MNWLTLVLFVIGLGLLIVGAEALVRGASRLAITVGISPLVIGLTVVAFGTSAPEMAVGVQGALSGQSGADITIGNVVGSNIFNILFILGLSAAISPLIVSRQLVRVDVPIMIGLSLLVWLLSLDGKIGRWEGVLLFACIVGYTLFAVLQGRKEGKGLEQHPPEITSRTPSKKSGVPANLLLILAGLGMLVLGSRWLVAGAMDIARTLGVSELIIGLTIVAAGTSLPEIATSVMASLRGERDIAVGNVVGSNIFNLLAVLGLSAMVASDGINVSPAALRFDIPVMVVTAIACLPIFFTGHLIARWEGGLFLGYYAIYTAFLVLASSQHENLGLFTALMILFVVPLTVITLAIGVVRQIKAKPGAG